MVKNGELPRCNNDHFPIKRHDPKPIERLPLTTYGTGLGPKDIVTLQKKNLTTPAAVSLSPQIYRLGLVLQC